MKKNIKIKVEYPIVEKVVHKTAQQMEELGYNKKELASYIPINREYNIYVKTNTSKKVVTCEELTGISDVEYQRELKRAWNE